MATNNKEQSIQPRLYQSQLEEIAIRKNTIIHLPTGSGKTLIACRLINRFRDGLQKPWGKGGKRTFFLVNTVPLVEQQKLVITKMCDVEGVGAYSSENKVDYWDKSKWDKELSKHQVIVMTSQILLDMLTHGYIRVEDINLIIFDECHHAVVDHPMRLIMKHFETCSVTQQPRVLGLTATLLNANVTIQKVTTTLQDLETTFHATIATVNELGEVLKYSTNPFELQQTYRNPMPTAASQEAVRLLTELEGIVMDVKLPSTVGKQLVPLEYGQQDITTDPKKIVKAVKNMIISMIKFINEMGVYGGAISILAYVILLERLKRKSLSKEEELLYQFTITQCTHARAILLKSMENEKGYDKIIKHSSEKVIQLLNILREYNPETFNKTGVLLKVNKSKKFLSGIIFTQQRFMAKIIFNLLKDVKEANPEEFGYLKHDFVVGFNVNPFNNTREQHYLKKSSEIALLKFSKQELNCLISTSVIEEGLDVPQCSLVVRYDQPLEYRSYIQSKGRARSCESSYVILIDEANKAKFYNQYNNFLKIEQYIQGVLVGKTDERAAPTEQDLQDLYDEDDIPPYITEYGNRLSAVSAISLLNRYCSVLPHDQFTVITPMWIQEKKIVNQNTVLRSIIIIMPIECPVKEKIMGSPMANLKSAKRSAALNACIRLHQEGELDPYTLLPRSYGVVEFEHPDIKGCFLNWPWDHDEDEGQENLAKAGTKKRMRKHRKVFPTSLKGISKFYQQKFYLHIIKLTISFPEPQDSRERALYKLLQRPEGFGFLTFNPLPKLCDFPLFLTVGEVVTTIAVNYAVIELNIQLLEVIKQFHYFIFNQVLAIAKQFLVYDGTENCMFVVPIKADNGYDIDWAVMQQYNEIPPVGVPSFKERKSLSVTRENYQYCVVTPWYRSSILPDRYIVSDVLEYMTPQSQFGTDSYGTYEDYYRNKYNLEILGRKDQPLLEVRHITSGMNCLLPRAATINAFTERQQKVISAAQGDDKLKGFIEQFVPEYCIKYEFPGVLWYKAMMLPSVLHRVSLLLVANDLRAEIAEATKYGHKNLHNNEKWLPIQVDLEIAINSLRSQTEAPVPINAVDRINNPNGETEIKKIPMSSMKKDLFELQIKKINQGYPWNEKMEPLDIERNLSTVTVMDIECYDEFVCAPLNDTSNTDSVLSPQRASTSSAILPPPPKFNNKIVLLTKTPTGRGPELRDVLAAITTIKSHDTFNLERAETLGDSFLKFAASLYLFHKFPKLNEGQLTNIKSRFIGNRNLYYAGARAQLGGRMKVEHFSPRSDFLIPGFFAPKKIQEIIEIHQIRPTFLIGMQFSQAEALSGSLSEESWNSVQSRFANCDGAAEPEPQGEAQNSMQCYVRSQAVSDKSVADCVEAIVGTYLLSGGILGAVKVLEWFRVMPPQDNFAQFLHKNMPTVISEGKATKEDVNFLLNNCTSDIERIINYKFKDPSYLLEAMSHPSYIRNRLTRSYERLEFLGDAILDFLITSHVFENCRQLKPGELTDLRSALVNNVTFASYVVKHNLHKYLCSQLNPVLDKAILNFVQHQEQRDHQIIEEVLYLIDEEESHIAEYVEVPKVLSDIFESLVGAIFLDCGGDLQTVWSVIYRIMWKEIENFSTCIPQQPVKVLYERVHACPVFGQPKVLDKDNSLSKVIMPVTITKRGEQYTVCGVGSNKHQAKRAAAKLALKILDL